MSAILNTFILLTQVLVIFAALPPIQKCQLSDPECIKKSAQSFVETFTAGIPEVGTEVLEPVHIDVIKIDLSGLKLTVRDADIKGLKKSVIDKLKVDTAKKVIELTYHVAPIVLKGKYKAGGMLLILPISGDGDVTIKIKNLGVTLTMPYDIVKNDQGKDVIELKSYKYTYENNENTHFKLTNLFNGNKQLSDAMHTFMNDNWKAISQEFGNPMLDKPIQKIYTAIKIFLKSQPLEEIAVV
ncbi:circadian clock-controlled protein daywake-like [Spodoptera frugiperda]|uniref:Circadian clock-controlled protein daywake-like n=2 Tax=Spodoptera frugiperda TaxID=7108 RepID=A0A9R0ECA0_SPOFR|nr:circadian clock-controlled protein daywake-like [Spodoptera frugiperda]